MTRTYKFKKDIRKGIVKQCKTCSNSFYLPPSRKDRLFCSVGCMGKNREFREMISKRQKGVHVSEETKNKLRDAHIGRHHSPTTEFKKGNVPKAPFKKGYVMSLETRKKISLNSNPVRGNKHPFWKGGVTSINDSIRKSSEYKLWRIAVFVRDSYTCLWCNKKGGQLHADHIKPFSIFPELRFAIDNGRTLCISCHKTTDTYGKSSKSLFIMYEKN